MGRAPLAVGLALCLLGCSREAVPLLTGGVPGYTESGGCFLGSEIGKLVVDQKYGTALMGGTGGYLVPVMWKPGFTGRRAGSEVEVLDPLGFVVATTGRKYQISGLYWAVEHDPDVLRDPNAGMGAGARPSDHSQLEIPKVFVACGDSETPQ